jgi:CheY-like chemotaxis protein
MNGKEAYEKVMENTELNDGLFCDFNLIFIDNNMPIMDGCDASLLIRKYMDKMNLEQPIIICVTGHTE